MTTALDRYEVEEASLQRAREGIHDGEFRLIGPVCDESVNDLIIDLKAYYKIYQPAPIELEIMSLGGSYTAGMALFDRLRWISNEGYTVTTYISGVAGSMGSVLAQAGDVRVIGREATLHMHELNSNTTGKGSKMTESALETTYGTQHVASIYAERSGLDFDEVHSWISGGAEVNFNAIDALDLGLVDEIRGGF